MGIVAFSIFQMREIEFIEKYKAEKGKEPSNHVMKQFLLTAASDQACNSYRTEANQLLNEFVNVSFGKKMDKLETILPDKINIENSTKPKSFFYGVLQSLTASFIVLVF
ncbi:MAG: hypothetical protein AAFO82_16360, partial [Bacteroidota bacterium]